MKKMLLLMAVFTVGLGCNQDSLSESLTPEALEYLSERYQFFVRLEGSGEQPMRYIFADDAPHVHAYAVKNQRAELVWELTDLDSPVSALLVQDLDKDGRTEILIATRTGRIMAYSSEDYHSLFEDFQETYTLIPCLIAANIDGDTQDEIIFIGQTEGEDETYMFVYDSLTRTFEWKTIQPFKAEEMLIANIDNDDQLEIILNTGFIIDTLFQTQEPGKVEPSGFGRNIQLLDINGDGFPEVIGETTGYNLKVYDMYSQRELW